MFIKVKVYPDAKKPKIIRKSEDCFEIYVKEKAERRLANKAVISALAKRFEVPSGRVKLVKGGKSKNKIFEIGL